MTSREQILETVLALPETDRIELAEALLSSFADSVQELSADDLKAELEGRWQDSQIDPDATMPWEEVKLLVEQELKKCR